jgi:hypothetical protein
LRSIGFSSFVIVPNGLAPLVFPLSSSSSKVSGSRMKIKVCIEMMVWHFPSEIFYA